MRRMECVVGLLLMALAAGPAIVRADDPPKPEEKVDPILAEWERRSSTIDTIDATFRATNRYPKGGDQTFSGRIILAKPNRALLDLTEVDAQGKETSRLDRISWTGDSVLQYHAEDRVLNVYRFDPDWPDPPGPACLPFFFKMTVERAKARYDWKFLKQDDRKIVLQATPRPGMDSYSFDRWIIELDRGTYQPDRMIVISNKDRDQATYQAIKIRVNGPVDVESWKERPPGWRVYETKVVPNGWWSRGIFGR